MPKQNKKNAITIPTMTLGSVALILSGGATALGLVPASGYTTGMPANAYAVNLPGFTVSDGTLTVPCSSAYLQCVELPGSGDGILQQRVQRTDGSWAMESIVYDTDSTGATFVSDTLIMDNNGSYTVPGTTTAVSGGSGAQDAVAILQKIEDPTNGYASSTEFTHGAYFGNTGPSGTMVLTQDVDMECPPNCVLPSLSSGVAVQEVRMDLDNVPDEDAGGTGIPLLEDNSGYIAIDQTAPASDPEMGDFAFRWLNGPDNAPAGATFSLPSGTTLSLTSANATATVAAPFSSVVSATNTGTSASLTYTADSGADALAPGVESKLVWISSLMPDDGITPASSRQFGYLDYQLFSDSATPGGASANLSAYGSGSTTLTTGTPIAELSGTSQTTGSNNVGNPTGPSFQGYLLNQWNAFFPEQPAAPTFSGD